MFTMFTTFTGCVFTRIYGVNIGVNIGRKAVFYMFTVCRKRLSCEHLGLLWLEMFTYMFTV